MQDPASFRDPEGSIFFEGGEVYRTLSAAAQKRMERLFKGKAMQTLLSEGHVVKTSLQNQRLNHEKIYPFSYPYEWSFDMLKDAALQQLHMNKALLEEGFILKDGSAFNSVYNNGRMTFIDILSIGDLNGSFWQGYSQFCQHFLYPLLLASHKNIPVNFSWKGRLQGVPLSICNDLFSALEFWKTGIFKHVFLQKKLADSLGSSKIKSRSVNANIPLALVRGLEKIILTLSPTYANSTWESYEGDNSYGDQDRSIKHAFIEKHVKGNGPAQVLDMGTNAGEYAKLASQYAQRVIAMDFDEACINRLYNEIKEDRSLHTIIPMVGNLMEPSPNQGWHLEERSNQMKRCQSDFFMALALMHHLCITENVPLESFVQFLKKMAPAGIVEWVSLEDDMVQFMMRNRENIFPHYTWENFKSLLERYFSLKEVVETHGGKRKLCFVER